MAGLASCIICSICCLVISVIIFLVLSFSQLPINTYGLDYSPITKDINPNVFTSGFHYLGFMHKFIEYPTTMQTLEFSPSPSANRPAVEARSNDGLMVTFIAQFQYQLNQGELVQLYTTYGEDYKTACIRYAVDVMNDEASQYNAGDFFKNLTTISTTMQAKLQGVYAEHCFSRVQQLQLSKVDLPKKFEDALTATNIAIQDSITIKQTLENVKIDMSTQVQNAQIAAPVVVNKATAEVNALLATNLAQMESFFQVSTSEAKGYQAMQKQMEFKTDAQLLDFIRSKTINQYNPKNLVVGV